MEFKRAKREELSINLTPLLDVVFLLLIFFMVSTSFVRESHVQLKLPEADASAPAAAFKGVELVVAANGQYSLNAQLLSDQSAAGLRRGLSAVLGVEQISAEDFELLIAADGRASHQAVVTAMEAAASLGIERINIATLQGSEQNSEQSSDTQALNAPRQGLGE